MAFYSDEIIEEVKAANDIVDVISQYVTLKRQGNTYFGLCPFHREKTSSFAVAPDKQIYHCFGCGEGGTVIRFVMKVENIGFKEAIEHLADRAKITLPVTNYEDSGISQDELKIREFHKNQMYAINKDAGRFFYDNISKSNIAKEYINKRKIDIATVRKFGLGFALDDNGLSKFLLSKGYNEEDILATGLVGKTEKGFLYDKFKNRFMFPIFDIRGRLVAFGGRTLESNEVMKEKHIPKYVNSPENLIYTKGKHLFGLNLAKKTSEKMKRILVVEGYMDVITPHQFGVTNVVASLGTALTEAQGRLLRQYAEEIVLSYDSDEAGQKAIMRGLEIMQSLGVTAKVLQMEGAKDPDEYVLKYGQAKFEKLIENSISLVEYKVKRLKTQYNLNDTTDKIKFLNKMADILSKVDNNIERDIYIDKLSKELGVGKEAINAEVEKINFKGKSNIKSWTAPTLIEKPSIVKKENQINDFEDTLIYLLTTKNKEIYTMIKNEIDLVDITSEVNKNLILKLYEKYENESIQNIEILDVCNSDEEFNNMTRILMKSNIIEDAEKVCQEVLKSYSNTKLQNEKKRLIQCIQNATSDEERKGYEIKLNELVIQLAKK